MKHIVLTGLLSLAGIIVLAQQNDPVVMHINGHPVTRSEFEYSYNKNNSEESSTRRAWPTTCRSS